MHLKKAHGKTEKLLTQLTEGVNNSMQSAAKRENSPNIGIWRKSGRCACKDLHKTNCWRLVKHSEEPSYVFTLFSNSSPAAHPWYVSAMLLWPVLTRFYVSLSLLERDSHYLK